jgi:monofunctional biosynthetic peptidoglycan transglycosylase
MRGGSTITQQVAKNLFLWQGRSYIRKALEFPLAFWIDLILSKRRVLEIYLNIAEWGPNGEFGAEAGARRAFGKSAQDLSRYEGLCWQQPCQIQRSATRAVLGRVCSGWPDSTWPGPQNRRLRRHVCVEATSVTASLPL